MTGAQPAAGASCAAAGRGAARPVAALPDHIARLELPTPYPVGPVNAYVVFGRRLTLIDVGPNTDDGEAALLDGLRELGLAPADIEQIVITHPHVDHHGGLDRFLRRHPGAKVAAHIGPRRPFFGGEPAAAAGLLPALADANGPAGAAGSRPRWRAGGGWARWSPRRGGTGGCRTATC